MRYWLYKCNVRGGPAGYSGDWAKDFFSMGRPLKWGGHYSTRSAEVANLLDNEVAEGDLIVAYQTDIRAVIGFCRVSAIRGPAGDKKLVLTPLLELIEPFPIHERKSNTSLEHSVAVNGPVMMRELKPEQIRELLKLTGSPPSLLKS